MDDESVSQSQQPAAKKEAQTQFLSHFERLCQVFNYKATSSTVATWYQYLQYEPFPAVKRTMAKFVTMDRSQVMGNKMPSLNEFLGQLHVVKKGMGPPPDAGNAIALPAFTGDGLPKRAEDMPPAPGRKYTEQEYAAQNYYLDLIRAMKLKKMGGAQMVSVIMAKMTGRDPSTYVQPSERHRRRVKDGFIPNAHDQTCLALADHLDGIREGRTPAGAMPNELGGRLLWTFSEAQKKHIRVAVARAKPAPEKTQDGS